MARAGQEEATLSAPEIRPMKLVIGDPAYSTWSVRPWLVLKRCGADFDTQIVRLNRPDTFEEIRKVSPNGKVPALLVDGEVIWDSLSIAVWCAERWPQAGLWPAEPKARWLARSAVCEMHSAFGALRNLMGMGPDHPMIGDSRAETPDDPALHADLRRMVELWRDLRGRFGAGGPYLFGAWSVADAFFTPVAARMRHFQVDLTAFGDVDGVAAAYRDALLNDPLFLEWTALAEQDLAAG